MGQGAVGSLRLDRSALAVADELAAADAFEIGGYIAAVDFVAFEAGVGGVIGADLRYAAIFENCQGGKG